MSTQISFQARSIFKDQPPSDNIQVSGATLQTVLAPVADPVSDAFNNVRFAATGAAGHGYGFSMLTVRARQRFGFTPAQIGRLTAHAHFTAQGAYSLIGRQPTSWFDGRGMASLKILIQMRVRVVARNGQLILNSTTEAERLFSVSAKGESGLDGTAAGVVDIAPFSRSISQSFPTIVTPSDRVQVEARYQVQAFASDGAEFIVDFSRTANPTDFSDGLNSPFAVINVT